MDDKIKISFEDLNNSKVDEDLKRQDMLYRMQSHQQTVAANTAPAQMIQTGKGNFWRGTVIYMILFGLLGGLVGWLLGEIPQYYREKNELLQFQGFYEYYSYIKAQGNVTDGELYQLWNNAAKSPKLKNNPYMNPSITSDEIEELAKKDREKLNCLSRWWYILTAISVSMFLSTAESIMAQNWSKVLINLILGIILGILGGIIVSLFVDQIYNFIRGDQTLNEDMVRQVLGRSIAWSIIGLFVAIAPGILMRSWKKFFLGLAGGFAGGLFGGLVFDLICHLIQNNSGVIIARCVGSISFGILAGVGTALLENVVKQGWLKIKAGLIAGKQFILYKNPTTIGSSPKCDVYLFKDPSVSGIHAAIHARGGNYILCSLAGVTTLVNGQPVTERTLKNGDMIQIGMTAIQFETKNAQQ